MKSKYFSTAALAVALLAGCSTKGRTTETDGTENVKIEVATVSLHDVEQLESFTATVEAEASNNIAPQSSGRIKKIFAEVGDHVAQGQKLAEMDAVNLEQARLQLENAQVEFERVDELYKVGGISKSAWDQQKMTYDIAKTSYANLVENTYLRSPISGVVTRRNYDNGDMWSMGEPIFVVERIRPVKLVVNVSESLFTKVVKGMEAGIVLDVYGDERFSGVVKLVHPSIDPATRTFPVEIQVANADERVRPGMFARVTFNFGATNRTTVPDRAVQKQSGSADRYVYVISDGVASYRKVLTGRLVGDEYEVLAGVEPGEQVAMTALTRLSDGARIEIVNQ